MSDEYIVESRTKPLDLAKHPFQYRHVLFNEMSRKESIKFYAKLLTEPGKIIVEYYE